ncbi:MAG: hypothetical protein EZS28_000743 [Streblomastix strix]|uniref:Uncharacterized protein n=1 Tax=Streblomastix strix TaxID=222440 RepID=A0A5J4X9C8_9EUKA|nr:MAG: hypothetical protein EZS28_000743 [Streblomastix strix]
MPEQGVFFCLRRTPRNLALAMNLIITPFLQCKDFFGLCPLAGALRVNKQPKSSLSLQEVVYNPEEYKLDPKHVKTKDCPPINDDMLAELNGEFIYNHNLPQICQILPTSKFMQIKIYNCNQFSTRNAN